MRQDKHPVKSHHDADEHARERKSLAGDTDPKRFFLVVDQIDSRDEHGEDVAKIEDAVLDVVRIQYGNVVVEQ